MVEKYEDLAETIHEQSRYSLVRPALILIRSVLQWIDRNLDQVPGRTITESKVKWMTDRLAVGFHLSDLLTESLQFTIVPDPEPTNEELLAEDLMQADANGGHAYREGYYELARHLIECGWTKAPGGDHD